MALINGFQRRAVSAATLFRTGADTLELSGLSGVSVNADTALNYSGIWACVRLLAGDISTMPVDAFRRLDGTRVPVDPQPAWIETPDPFDPSITRIDHFAQVAISLLLDGNAFVLGTPSVLSPERLEVLNPRRVEVRKPDRTPEYRLLDPSGRWGDGLNPSDIIHVKINAKPGQLRGMSPIEANKGSIGISLAAQKWVETFFGKGAQMPGFIEVPAGASQTSIDEMSAELQKRHGGWRKAGLLGFLTDGSAFKPTGISPKDAELNAIFAHQLEEGARIYGIPPFMIGSQEPAGVAYASSVERAQHYIDHCLIHYTSPIEAAYNRMVPGDRRLMSPGSDTFIKFNLNSLLKGNPKERSQYFKDMRELGVLNGDAIARFEDYPPPEDGSGKAYWRPIANYEPIPKVEPKPEPVPLRVVESKAL